MTRRSFVQCASIMAALLELSCHKTFTAPTDSIDMKDSRWDGQLSSGFYPVEGNGWRWTKRTFSLSLMPPANAAHHAIALNLRLYIPPSQINALGPLTLSANIDGCDLEPETFLTAGAYTYSRVVPSKLAMTNILPIKFSFDRAVPNIGSDHREMAAVVRSVGIYLK